MEQLQSQSQSQSQSQPKHLPLILFGTYNLFQEDAESCVKYALSSNNHNNRKVYGGVDCAPIYKNQAYVGRALKFLWTNGVRTRDELWIQTKLWRSSRISQVVSKLRGSLKQLQLDYVDCYLMHWPGPGRFKDCPPVTSTEFNVTMDEEKWCPVCKERDYVIHVCKQENVVDDVIPTCPREWVTGSYRLALYSEMCKALELGLARSLGVCNCSYDQIVELLNYCEDNCLPRPYIVQNEFHPYLNNQKVLKLCAHEGIKFQAHSSLGGPYENKSLLENKVVKSIAAKKEKTASQILFRWSIDSGCYIITKSKVIERIDENADVFDWELELEESSLIAHLCSHVRRDDTTNRNCMYSWKREHDPDKY